MAKIVATLKAKDAMNAEIKTSGLYIHLTGRYIWIMKLRRIWAIIREKVGDNKPI